MASTDGARRAAADIVKGEAVMIEIDYKNRDPIYLQIVQSILKNIMLGNLREGDQLPTMRQLAIDLGINPNTVQKAYRELERDEVTYTIPGKGSFVGPSKKIDMELRRQFRGRFVELVREVKNFGVTLEEIESTINELLTEEKERGGGMNKPIIETQGLSKRFGDDGVELLEQLHIRRLHLWIGRFERSWQINFFEDFSRHLSADGGDLSNLWQTHL